LAWATKAGICAESSASGPGRQSPEDKLKRAVPWLIPGGRAMQRPGPGRVGGEGKLPPPPSALEIRFFRSKTQKTGLKRPKNAQNRRVKFTDEYTRLFYKFFILHHLRENRGQKSGSKGGRGWGVRTGHIPGKTDFRGSGSRRRPPEGFAQAEFCRGCFGHRRSPSTPIGELLYGKCAPSDRNDAQ